MKVLIDTFSYIISAFLFLVLPIIAEAATYYVAPNGNNSTAVANDITRPWATINTAIAAASPGDTVVLRGGTFSQSVSIDKPNITLKGNTGERAIIQVSNNNSSIFQAVYFDVNSSGGKLQNLEVIGGYYYTVKLEAAVATGSTPGASNIVIEDSILHDSGRDVIKVTPGCNAVTVRRCEIYNSGVRDASNAEGIDNVNGDDFVLQDSYIHDIATTGIYTKGGARNTLIERNRFLNTGAFGVSLGFETDTEFFDTAENPNYYENINGTVRNNLIVNATYGGIGLYAASGAQVYNNTLINVAQQGRGAITFGPDLLRGTQGNNATIRNNAMVVSSGRWLVEIRSNSFTGTPVLSNNRYYSTTAAARFIDERTGFSGNFAQWQAQVGETASSEGNPQLDANHKPLTGSPLIDAGVNIGGLVVDLAGNLRPQGAVTDIGAYEFGISDTTRPSAPRNLSVR